MSAELTFGALVSAIDRTHARLHENAVRAVNVSLTLRNWTIGGCIAQYELRGADRAEYGASLYERLSERLRETGGLAPQPRELRRWRQFYEAYPQIRAALPPELAELAPGEADGTIWAALPPESAVTARRLLQGLSYTHFVELLGIDEAPKRAFYEEEALRGGWSARELRRQIGSLYFERTLMSTDRGGMVRLANEAAERQGPGLVLRDPYVFEFLGLRSRERTPESAVEDALLDKLQEFLLELGRGFCFEARQRRILIGEEHFFVDLVFYHRILKCHVLIELKSDAFKHEHLGQLNTYLNWYRVHEMAPGDNPPIGLLLCTAKNHALVEYATAGLDNKLFVTKYQLELPSKEEIERVLESGLREHGS